MTLKSLFRLASWLAFAAIAIVTLDSPEYRPTTMLPHDAEHALAFITAGLLFGLGYPAHRRAVVLGAVPVIGLLEISQMWADGRHARVEDFVVNLTTFWGAFFLASFLAAHVALRRAAPAADRG